MPDATAARQSAADPRVKAVRRLAAACAKKDGVRPFDEAVLLDLDSRGLPSDADLVSVDDRAAAWLTADGEAADLHLAVEPSLRGQGVGQARAEILVDAWDGPVRAWSHGDHPAARCIAESLGFSRARELWVMRRPPVAESPLPELPDAGERGVRLRHLGSREADGGPSREQDRDRVIAVNAAAFADHPEQGDLDVEAFEQRAEAGWFEAEGLLLAEDAESEDLLGFHWTKLDGGAGEPGEIYVLGIAPQAQGRGLGSLLSLAGLHHLHERGADGFLLYVEAGNKAAVRTYEKLGFTHAGRDTHVQYARD